MPYDNTDELPAAVRELDDDKQRQWLHVFNSVMDDTGDEGSAARQAWGVVNKSRAVTFDELTKAGDWDEDKHPRGKDGKFAPGQGVVVTGNVQGKGTRGVISQSSPSGSHYGVSDEAGRHVGYYDESDLSSGINKSDEYSFSLEVPIIKTNNDQQLVYGWASVVKEGEFYVIDHQGDIIKEDELVRMAHAFMTDARSGGHRHERRKDADAPLVVGKVVESVVMTEDVQKALGIDLGKVGWWVVMKVDDAQVWQAVKAGELSAFSIGGKGVRVPVEVVD